MPISPSQNLTIADSVAIRKIGWTILELQEQIVALDRREMADLTDRTGGTAEQWSPVYREHRESWRVLLDGDRQVIGYWHFVIVNATEFQKAMRGALVESSVTPEKLVAFELPGLYDMYFAGFVLDQDHRTPATLRLLLNSLLDVVQSLAQNEVFFRRICANAFTSSGASMCRTLGFEKVADHCEHGEVFVALAENVLRRTFANSFLSLRRLYNSLPTLPLTQSTTVLRISFLTANANPLVSLDLEAEMRQITKELDATKFRNALKLQATVAAQSEDIITVLRDQRPDVLHFSAHGSEDSLLLRSQTGGAHNVSLSSIKECVAGRGVRLLVLSSCDADVFGSEFVEVVPSVIAAMSKIEDTSASYFARIFYRGIGDGLSIGDAFRDAIDSLRVANMSLQYKLFGDAHPILAGPDAST